MQRHGEHQLGIGKIFSKEGWSNTSLLREGVEALSLETVRIQQALTLHTISQVGPEFNRVTEQMNLLLVLNRNKKHPL